MIILPSAHRHGLTDEDIRHAVANLIRAVLVDDGLLILGPDLNGEPIELLSREGDEFIVFHAMALGAKFRRYLP